jgi:hypothetical protein
VLQSAEIRSVLTPAMRILIAPEPIFATLLAFRLKTRCKHKYSGEEIGGKGPERLGARII